MWKWETEQQPKAVVAIFHSAYEHHAWYAWLIEKLRKSGFHVVMGDLPGHGSLSRRGRYHDEAFSEYYLYAKQLIEVAHTYNLPVFIIANGLGGTVAARTVCRHQIQCAGVIFISPWLHLKLEPGKLTKALSSLSAITSSVKLKHDITLHVLTRNSEVYDEMKDDVPFIPVVTVGWYRELQQAMKILKEPDFKLPNIPVLMMTGGRDKLTDIAATKHWLLQQNLTNFYYREWPDSLSSLYFEMERQEVFLLTEDFMNNSLRSLGYIIE